MTLGGVILKLAEVPREGRGPTLLYIVYRKRVTYTYMQVLAGTGRCCSHDCREASYTYNSKLGARIVLASALH